MSNVINIGSGGMQSRRPTFMGWFPPPYTPPHAEWLLRGGGGKVVLPTERGLDILSKHLVST